MSLYEKLPPVDADEHLAVAPEGQPNSYSYASLGNY